jgi:glycosyltransferase involved in cell wall biosynthesis
MNAGVRADQTPKRTPSKSVSLVIPAYNEQDRLQKALEQYLPVLEGSAKRFEVIVVADGKDGTPELANRYAARGVRCERFDHKLGRGGAVLQGLRLCSNEIVAYADADGSVPGSDFERMLDLSFNGYPCVIASRRVTPESVVVPETFVRRFAGTAWRILVRSLLGLRIKDAQCGLKIFHKSVIDQSVLTKLTVTNRTFEVGMLYHIQASGEEIREVPVAYVHDFNTRMPVLRAIPVMFLTLVGMFFVNVVALDRNRLPPLLLDLNLRWSSV